MHPAKRTSSYPPSHPSREPLNHTSWTNESNKGKHWHQTQSIIYVYSLQYLSYSLIVFIYLSLMIMVLFMNINLKSERSVLSLWTCCALSGTHPWRHLWAGEHIEATCTAKQILLHSWFEVRRALSFPSIFSKMPKGHWNKSLPGEQQEPVVASVFWGLTRDKTCCPIRHSLGLQEKVQLNYNSASLSFCLACLTANPAAPIFAPC